VKAAEQVASPSFEPKREALGEYLGEENLERLGRGARALADHGNARAEKFVQQDLHNLPDLLNGARRDARVMTHNQKMTVAARAMADRKSFGQRS
jgi:hypothetical protein